jgi:hypothetical protein
MTVRFTFIARRAALVALAFGLVATPVAPAAAHGPDPTLSGGLFGQNQALEFRWRSGSEPAGAVRNAILAAADDNNDSRASKSATFAYDSTAANLIGYGTGTCGVNGLACFTRSAPTGFSMWLREHGRVFDWGTLRWCQMQAAPTNGCYDAETIALDEFGHIQVLNHHVNYSDERDYTDAVVQTFSRTRPKTGWNMHAFGICDTATLQIRYDVSTLSSLYSKCLDVATVLSLAASETSISYGGQIDISSVLKVATNTSLGRLSANPIGARTIRLQRRAIGSSTWANVATLTSTSPTGTYVGSIHEYATADYRAVFSTPTNEGLRGDTSPTVRVTVNCPLSCPEP